jgi:hypothetical protein
MVLVKDYSQCHNLAAMKTATSNPNRSIAIAVLAIAAGLGGCAGRNPFLSYGPQPRVEDCAQIQQATPTRYICDGKQYTSVQLSDIRAGKSPTSAK